jgi:hypothetical protein
MAERVTPEFYWSEAERLLQLAATTVDRITRIELLEVAARFREAAAQLHGKHAQAANTNEAVGDGSETA